MRLNEHWCNSVWWSDTFAPLSIKINFNWSWQFFACMSIVANVPLCLVIVHSSSASFGVPERL